MDPKIQKIYIFDHKKWIKKNEFLGSFWANTFRFENKYE